VGFDQMDSRLIYEEARKGDPLALEAFEVTGRILGAKLAESVLHTRPQAFIFFGGLAKAGDLILEPTRRSLDQHLMPIFRGKVEIIPSGIQVGNAAVLGAAALIWNELQKDRIQAPGSGSGTAL
jgi:glucokinase